MRNTVVLFFFFLVQMSFAQKSDSLELPKNSISLEIAGNAFLFGSLNYERVFHLSGKFYLSGRAGMGALYFMNVRTINVPVLINAIYHIGYILSMEAGVGTTLFFKKVIGSSKENGVAPLLTGLFGIRLQHPRKGFCFKAGFTPLIEMGMGSASMFSATFIPMGGFSFGYSF
jgi:hypothetical protein